jgi:hypothetical protein
MADKLDDKRSGWRTRAWFVVILLALYLLSSAPVYWFLFNAWREREWADFYFPIVWLIDTNSIAADLFQRYLGFWEPIIRR